MMLTVCLKSALNPLILSNRGNFLNNTISVKIKKLIYFFSKDVNKSTSLHVREFPAAIRTSQRPAAGRSSPHGIRKSPHVQASKSIKFIQGAARYRVNISRVKDIYNK